LVAISGFQASDIGQYGIGDLTFWTNPTGYGDWWDVPVPVGALYDIFRPWRDPPARSVVPPMGVFAPTGPTGQSAPQTAGNQAVPTAIVIDPDLRPKYTVYEDAPGGIYETNRAETDWDEVYRQYVILNAPEPEVLHDSIDWGAAVGTILGGVSDPFGIGRAASAFFQPRTTVTGIPSLGQQQVLAAPRGVTMQANGCPPLGPKYAKICLATGDVTPLRRRRRRRLLTSSDIKDLAALKTIVGGAALQGAVVQAIRR